MEKEPFMYFTLTDNTFNLTNTASLAPRSLSFSVIFGRAQRALAFQSKAAALSKS